MGSLVFLLKFDVNFSLISIAIWYYHYDTRVINGKESQGITRILLVFTYEYKTPYKAAGLYSNQANLLVGVSSLDFRL